MKFALYIPNYGDEISARSLAELGQEAEQSGWDGIFLWDHILLSRSQKFNIVDPWVALTAVAMQTEHLRLGTSVTPVSRYRPWRLARITTTLDNLSNGRLILSVGLGEPADMEFAAFGEEPATKVRAEKLDEGLDILNGLWSGNSFGYKGKHYQLKKVAFRPVPTQSPRIPVWVGGFWPNPRPFRRAALWDGVMPLKRTGGMMVGAQDLAEILAFIRQYRQSETQFDAAVIGSRSALGKKPADISKALGALEAVGATWWLQGLYMERNSAEKMRTAIRQGPPG